MNDGQGLLELLGVTPEQFRAAAFKRTNLDLNSFDAQVWQGVANASDELQRLAGAGATIREDDRVADAWGSLLQDTFGAFYKPYPDLLPEDRVEPNMIPNRPILQRLLEDPATEQVRVNTKLDELASAIATMAAGEVLLEEFQKRPDLIDPPKPQEGPQGDPGGDDGQGEGNGQGNGPGGQQPPQGQQQGANPGAGGPTPQAGPSPQALRRAAHKAAEAGRNKAAEAQAVLAGWGLESGDLSQIPMEQRIELVQRLLSGNLRTIADMVGRMKNLARSKQREKIDLPQPEVQGVELGNDLRRILPSELCKLADPDLEVAFYRKWRSRSLVQYHLHTKERKGKGPMVKAIDISGSMSGLPLTWAIGLNMGMVDTAARQKRAAAVAFFDTQVKKTIEWAPGEKDAQKLIDMATTGTAGGTKFHPAMSWGLEKIQTAGFEKADFVMTTDGLCNVPDEFLQLWNAERRRLKFRTYAVLIAAGVQMGRRKDGNGRTNRLADMHPEDTRKIFGQICDWADDGWAVPALDPRIAGTKDDTIAGTIFENIFM